MELVYTEPIWYRETNDIYGAFEGFFGKFLSLAGFNNKFKERLVYNEQGLYIMPYREESYA